MLILNDFANKVATLKVEILLNIFPINDIKKSTDSSGIILGQLKRRLGYFSTTPSKSGHISQFGVKPCG